MVAMHHEIPGSHLVGIHRPAGGLTPAPDISAGTQGLLPEEFPVGDQRHPPGGKLQPFQLRGALGFQRHRGVLFDQTLDRLSIGAVGNEAADAVVLFK